MGSCVSRPNGDGDEAPEQSTADRAQDRRRGRDRDNGSSAKDNGHDAPLRPVTPLARSPKHLVQHPPPWTHAILQRERMAHFETQAELHPEIQEVWYAVQLASEKMREGKLAEASSLLKSVGISCPSGKFTSGKSSRDQVKGGLFDRWGREYRVPGWCVVDPEDLVDMEAEDSSASEASEDWGDDLIAVNIRPVVGNEKTITVNIQRKRPTKDLKILAANRLNVKAVRLTYRGRVLDGANRFEDAGYKDGDVVNAQILE